MAVKTVVRFNGLTSAAPAHAILGYSGKQHAFGFSEHYWHSTGDVASAKTFFRNSYAPARAAILPANVTIVDALIYGDGAGRGVPVPIGTTGSQANSDQVNVAALCSSRHPSAPHQRRWWVHCLPDIWVQNGELHITVAQSLFFRTYFNVMMGTSWLGLVQNDLRDIVSVTTNGLVSLPGASPYSVGQLLRVVRTLDANNRRRGGQKFVGSVGPLTHQFTLNDWTFGATTGGQIFRPTYTFYSLGDGEGPFVERSGTKKVGRPFDLYRGRQPARRP